jgi:hypothetical protein
MTTAQNYSDYSSDTYEKTGSTKDALTDPQPGDFRESETSQSRINRGLQVPQSLFAGPTGDASVTERNYLRTPYLRKTKKYDLFGDDPACNNKTGEACPEEWRVNFAHFPCEF